MNTTPKAVRSCAYDKCKREFLPARPMQAVCGPLCAKRLVKAKEDAKKAAEKEMDKARKEALESIKEVKADAQAPFNKYIRLRDAHLPCVSCGIENPPMKPGGQWDAGHFLSRGARPELAFDEDNCHKQCKSCNAGGGRFAHKARTVNARYEEELLRRIGPERLARLKGPHPVKKWTRDELRSIAALYREKVKELLREDRHAG